MGVRQSYVKITQEIRNKVIRLAIDENLSALVIAERMGISFASVYKIFKEEKVAHKRRLGKI